MKWSRVKSLIVLGVFASLLVGVVAAQEGQERQRIEHRAERAESGAAVDHGSGANAGVADILANTTEAAAHTADSWGRRFGLSKDVSFGISLAVNFAGIVVFCWALMKSRLPQAFRERNQAIQKGIKDAQAASADASRRLTDIETRLGKLDSEVAEIRRSAESQEAAEEQRIRQAAEQDKQKIIEGAEAEIEAIARNAQRELKGYAASLAVDLAARRIHVDEPTDQTLVRDFVGQLGKEGR